MAKKKNIDETMLRNLVDSGKTVVELVSYFGVSNSLIRDRLKRMGLKAATPIVQKLSEETKRKLSESQKKWLAENPDKHPWRNIDRYNTVPCKKVKEFLSSLNIQFVEEFQPNVGGRFFSIDIALPDKKIALEINGNQHYERTGELTPYYQERHDILEAHGWTVYEIHYSACFMLDKWVDFVNQLKESENKIDFDYFNYTPRITERTLISCLNCGKEIKARSKRCSNCAPFERRKKEFKIPIPSKEEMRKLLTEKKSEILAKEFGTSRRTFRSLVESMGLSLQPRGFFNWRKLKKNEEN